MPGTPDSLISASSASTYHLVSAASTNAGVVKASAGVVTAYYLANTAAVMLFVKLYNKASSPTVGSDTPRCVWGIPSQSGANISFDHPIAFETGIAIATTTGIADSDSAAVGANDIAVTLHYL